MILATLALTATLASAQTAHTNLPAQRIYPISGRVIDNEGKPAGSVRVCAIADDFDESKPNVVIPCARSSEQGHFWIVLRRTGKFTIHYDQVEQGYMPSRFPFFRHPTTVPPEVVIDDPGSHLIHVTMAPRNGVLLGRTVDSKTGLPLESVEFILCHASNAGVCNRTVVKGSDGRFKLPAPHVPFTLRVRADGFNEWTGLRGADSTELSIGSGASLQLDILLTRHLLATNRAINELEKQAGINLPAPTLLSPADGIVFNHYPRKTKLEWSPVDGAAFYSLEVDYCQPGRDRNACVQAKPLELPGAPSMKGVLETGYEFYFVGAQPGRWRVWAVDKEGREGFKSPWRMFVYLK